MLIVVASQACYLLTTMLCMLTRFKGSQDIQKPESNASTVFIVLKQCTAAWTDLSDDSANVDLSCQAYNRHPDALLLGNLDGVLDVAWITGGQASKKHQDLYSNMFLNIYFCKQSCPGNMLTVGFQCLLGDHKPQ